MRRSETLGYVLLLGGVAFAVTAASVLAGRLPLFLDEAVTLNEALMPSVGDVVTAIQQWDPGKPPLYFLLIHAWLQVVPANEFWLRFPSVVFTGLSVPLMYALGRLLFGARIALVGCLLLAVNPWFLWVSAWARTYSLFFLLTLGSSYLLERLLREGRVRDLLFYAASIAFFLYVHLFVGFIVLFHLCYVFVTRRRALPQVGLALALSGVAYLPWLGIAYRQAAAPGDYSEVPTFWNLVGLFKHLAGSEWLAVLFAPLFVLGLVRNGPLGRYGAAARSREIPPLDLTFPLLWLGVPIVLLFGICWTLKAVYSFHYLLFVLPAFLWIIAAGVEQLLSRLGRRFTIACVVAVAVLSVSSLRTNRVFRRPDVRSAANYVAAQRQAGDIVLVENPAWCLVYSFYDSAAAVLGVPEGFAEELHYRTAPVLNAPNAKTAWVVTPGSGTRPTSIAVAAEFELARVSAVQQRLVNGERDRLQCLFP